MKITIALCTHNRSDLFGDCLRAVAPQLGPEFELVVVDSASTPEHAAIVADLVAQYPNVAFLRMEKPGLSIARNAALKNAKGEWFVTLDDDAIAAPDWAETALALTSSVSDRYSIIGGAVHPILPKGAERALGTRWQQLLSTIELRGEYDQTDHPRVVAANLCFRRKTLVDVGGFPENLGRVGRSLVSGEDKFPVHLMLRQGYRIWYSDRLVVGHHIHRDRLTRRWASRRAYWDGRSDRRIERMMGIKAPLPKVLSVTGKFLGLTPVYFVPGPQEYFLRFWYNLGWLQETIIYPLTTML